MNVRRPQVAYTRVATVERVGEARGAVAHDPETIVVVRRDGRYRNAVLRCPCGCDDIVVLNLDRGAGSPSWHLRLLDGRLTLVPSVWRTEHCGAHFVLHDNEVWWCGPLGDVPDLPADLGHTLKAWWRALRRRSKGSGQAK